MGKRNLIDKEAMFQKIMPTASTPPSAPQETGLEPESEGPIPQPEAPVAIREVGLHETEEPVLVNLMEYLVAGKLDEAFEKFNCCRCDKCRKDVAAIALNKLPPQYTVVKRGEIEGLTAALNSQEVTKAIVQAVLQVRSNPRH